MIRFARWLGWNLVVFVFKHQSYKGDPFTWLTANMLGKPELKVTYEERKGCKRSLYNALYCRTMYTGR